MNLNKVAVLSALLGFTMCPLSAFAQTAEKPKRFPQLTLEQVDPITLKGYRRHRFS